MKKLILPLLLLTLSLATQAQTPDQKGPKDLRGILLELLKTTHNQKEWFVPGNAAIDGLTPAQAKWTDGSNHSVGQLTYHLVFWNSEQLAKFKGEKPPSFDGNNDETFNDFNAKNWPETVKKFDQVMTDWEKAVETAPDAKLEEWASTIEHVGAHNAYHIGQIIYVRKLHGTWNPANGVK
jgi:uncharacterized damage-inducible protein DinB